jgi:hypothetical protein
MMMWSYVWSIAFGHAEQDVQESPASGKTRLVSILLFALQWSDVSLCIVVFTFSIARLYRSSGCFDYANIAEVSPACSPIPPR